MSKRSGAGKALVLRLFGGAVAAAAASCASGADEEPAIELATSEEDLRFYQGRPAEYFRFEPDRDDIAWPPQTGRVEALNRSQTRCADGAFADSCQIAQLRIEKAWIPSPSYILRGRLQREDVGLDGQEGVFIGEALWAEVPTADDTGVAEAVTFRVSQSRFECATSSCPALRVEKLNSRIAHLATELDTSHLDLSPEYLALIQQLVTEDELIVRGELERQRFQLWPKLVVSRVFVPPVVECTSDEDCPADTWCRATQTDGYVCEPYRGEGELCGAEAGMETRCALPPFCITSNFPNVPAVCRAACKGHCGSGKYCTFHGCLPAGTCEIAADCLHQVNDWEHADCPGYPSCEPVGNQALCVWHCGNPACVDITGFRPGGCAESLGYGRYGDRCGEVVGCVDPSNGAPAFSETREECETQCLQSGE